MPPRKRNPQTTEKSIHDYRHADKRKNIPPAGLAAQGKVQDAPRTRYAYDPHLPPVLRFDETGETDRLPELLEIAKQRPLTGEEADILAGALHRQQPWLEWSGKREKSWFEVDPVALHIHERVSAQAILKLAAREPIQRSLFADPEMEYRQAVQFYKHDMDWSNRLILGDSLVVMNSLARREDLAGKVQMIYFDPPYGIKFASNFQAQVGKRDVKDREADLTREPEQVKAYRDTWTLGVHSYLAYLRDRLITARELLADSGSLFIQISDENLHRVRLLMDEVFGEENFVSQVSFVKTTGFSSTYISSVTDYLLWYSKKIKDLKYKQLYKEKVAGEEGAQIYRDIRTFVPEINFDDSPRLGTSDQMTSQGAANNSIQEVLFQGKRWYPPAGLHWKTTVEGIQRLVQANRVIRARNSLRYLRLLEDFPIFPIVNLWADTSTGSFTEDKIYVVQTGLKTIERCILMTTDPGDLVLDPTCGSGTTAYVAEQWGRRWITIDTSRVAVALARQRLLTAKYDYYELKDPDAGPHSGFDYKTVPHITLKSIAQNQALDPIFAKWEPILAEKLVALNQALAAIPPEIRARLQGKLLDKERREGKSSITEADRRRWQLPKPNASWQEWEVPFDTDPDWPSALQDCLRDYRTAWRGKMDEVNAAIAASAPQEKLVDQPRVKPGVLRVSGPFTVEGVQPVEESLDMEGPIESDHVELETFDAQSVEVEPENAAAYIEKMIRLLRQDGVRFPDNKVMGFHSLDPLPHTALHAAGEWGGGMAVPTKVPTEIPAPRRVAASFGPQYGPVTAVQVEEALWAASRGGYDDLVIAGFSIDGAAQAIIEDDPNPRVRVHLAHIRPDVNMGDLLKDTPSSQLFTVFGLPQVELKQNKNGEWAVELQGVDIYDPVENTIHSTGVGKVAAWFLDSDYDGQTFCISQAFFPDRSAWDKLARALKTVVDPERFEAFSGKVSLPFPAGKHQRIAVKVIDPRGNEVMRVLKMT